MKKLFCLTGRSAAGKDTMYARLLAQPPVSLRPLVIYTTRPMREGEKEGVQYHFTDEEGLNRWLDAGKVAEKRSYQTVNGIWTYFTVDDGCMDADDGCHVLTIGTLESCRQLRDYFGYDRVEILYIDADEEVLRARARAREDAREHPDYEEMRRRFEADRTDFSPEKLGSIGISGRFDNSGDEDECFRKLSAFIRKKAQEQQYLSRGTKKMERKNSWKTYDEKALAELEGVCAAYREFLDAGKTERECVKQTVKMAKAAGYRDMADVTAAGERLSAGDKVYAVCRGKAIALFQIGTKRLTEGMRILGAHIDSPRLDVKQNPLYEDSGMAYFDTHYYGGVKKYQWVTIPLALHGVVAKKDGTVTEVCIGEDPEDPVLCVTDLLIHLSADQLEKKARVVIEGEKLDLLVGSRPAEDKSGADVRDGKEDDQDDSDTDQKKKGTVRDNILKILKEKYGMEEEDFFSAELEIVPAGKARECGLDRSMILSYGQDDRVCAFTCLSAQLQTQAGSYTTCCLLVDKEEIGSVGATGMQSRFFENTVARLLALCSMESELNLRMALERSRMISSDVDAAFDPLYAEVFEKKNSAYFGRGLAFNKFTGSRGKSGSNDADAEYIAWLRAVMDNAGVAWQMAELGKVDVGGGGTIAYINAAYGMDVIDGGVAVLSMHAPWEVTSKADVYEAWKGYRAFLSAE